MPVSGSVTRFLRYRARPSLSLTRSSHGRALVSMAISPCASISASTVRFRPDPIGPGGRLTVGYTERDHTGKGIRPVCYLARREVAHAFFPEFSPPAGGGPPGAGA